MKNTKTKIILSAIIFLSVVVFPGIVSAADPFLYISPANLTKTVGSTFGASIGVNTLGSKVCAVEGTLVFSNLNCQSIIIASSVNPQSSPTCPNPYFLIGVPGCTTADKVLFTVSVKAGNAGTSSISLTGVDIIGEGVSIGSVSISGNYTINAVPTPETPTVETPTVETPTPEIPTPETPTVETPTVETPTIASPEEKGRIPLLAAISSIMTFNTGNIWIGILAGFVIFAIVVYVIYAFIYRKRKNSGKI